MAIVKMSKFDLVVFAEQRAKVLKKLQKFKEVNENNDKRNLFYTFLRKRRTYK